MNEKDNQDPNFKVVDKRRYTSEGEKIDSADVRQEPVANQKPKTEEKKEQGAANKQEAASSKRNDPSAEQSSVDFPSFVMSLAHQTLVLMGEAPNPETNLVSQNLEAAQQTIDILALLEAKTKGNLDKDEEKLMEEVLSGLRLAFVNKSNAVK